MSLDSQISQRFSWCCDCRDFEIDSADTVKPAAPAATVEAAPTSAVAEADRMSLFSFIEAARTAAQSQQRRFGAASVDALESSLTAARDLVLQAQQHQQQQSQRSREAAPTPTRSAAYKRLQARVAELESELAGASSASCLCTSVTDSVRCLSCVARAPQALARRSSTCAPPTSS